MSFLEKLSEAKHKVTDSSLVHDLIEHFPAASKVAEKLTVQNDDRTQLPGVDFVEGCVTPPNWGDRGPAPRGRDAQHEHQHGGNEPSDRENQNQDDRSPIPPKDNSENTQDRRSESTQEGDARSKTRESYRSAVEGLIPSLTESLPVRKGEGYYQVLSRMFPALKERDLSTLAHDVEKLNGSKILHTGEKFDILSDFGKKRLSDSIMSDYDRSKEDSTGETKRRERFNPPYDRVMSQLAGKIEKAAETAVVHAQTMKLPDALHNSLPMRPERRVDSTEDRNAVDQSRHAERSEETPKKEKQDGEDGASEVRERTEQQDKEVYESLKDFVSACAELKKQGEMLQFLGKWYTPDTNMYAHGMEKYADALDHVQESAAQLKATMTEQKEKEQLHSQWREFMLKQQRAMAEFRRNLPILGTAYQQRFESQNIVETI